MNNYINAMFVNILIFLLRVLFLFNIAFYFKIEKRL